MRPVDLRFFAYGYNVYNRWLDVFVALLFSLCVCVVWLVAACAPSDDIFSADKYVHVTSHFVGRFIWSRIFIVCAHHGIARTDSAFNIANVLLLSLTLLCDFLSVFWFFSASNLFVNENSYTLCFFRERCIHFMLFVIRQVAVVVVFFLFVSLFLLCLLVE